MNNIIEINVGEVKNLLASGKKVKVQAPNNEFVNITNFVEKGILDTYEVKLENKKTIKTSREHKFFTTAGWVETQNLRPNETKIFCDDDKYYLVLSVDYIGKHRIVDITVDSKEHAYFGNGMLNHNTGKSLVSAHIMANTQKKGGIAVYIDTEASVSTDFWKSIGVNIDRVLYLATETVEDIFVNIEKTIAYIRNKQPDALVTIIVDSVAGASTKSELESEHGKTGYATDKSIIISKAMRKITTMIGKQKILIVFTNQLRQNINAMAFGEKYVVSGGKALAYHTSVRVRLNNVGKIKKDDEIIGNECKAVVIKNRMGPPNRQASFNIYYDSGIADYSSWLDILKKIGTIKQAGPYYKYTDDKGEEQQFQSKNFINMIQNDVELKNKFYNQICDSLIMKYKDPNSQIVDDAVIDSEEDTEENKEDA